MAQFVHQVLSDQGAQRFATAAVQQGVADHRQTVLDEQLRQILFESLCKVEEMGAALHQSHPLFIRTARVRETRHSAVCHDIYDEIRAQIHGAVLFWHHPATHWRSVRLLQDTRSSHYVLESVHLLQLAVSALAGEQRQTFGQHHLYMHVPHRSADRQGPQSVAGRSSGLRRELVPIRHQLHGRHVRSAFLRTQIHPGYRAHSHAVHV
mmetsp:Transcript_3688/g.6199  ORF Transcript_3688/g.6199 Transcript_3688/m.6199 type:complete len:208 (-) Transcript_3688:925-1548(-)